MVDNSWCIYTLSLPGNMVERVTLFGAREKTKNKIVKNCENPPREYG
jgi:hypothetical protein